MIVNSYGLAICIINDSEDANTVCAMLNAKPEFGGHAGVFYRTETAPGVIEEGIKNKLIEMGWHPPVKGLQELSDLWKWADAVLEGFCGGKQTPELTRKYKIRRKTFKDFRKTLIELGVENLD